MTTKRDVECFLEQFKIKLDIYDIVFRTRTNDKNERTLFALDITSRYRKDVIRNLEVRDYSQGPPCGRTLSRHGNVGVRQRCKRTGSLYKDKHGSAREAYDLHLVSHCGTSYAISI